VTKWFLLFGLMAGVSHAQMSPYAPPPDTYSLTETNVMFIPDLTMTIVRDGNRALMDQTAPPSKKYPAGFHTKTYLQLPEGKSYTVDTLNPSAPCKVGSAKLDWADPFGLSAQLHKQLDVHVRKDRIGPKINGMDSHEVVMPQLTAFLELKYGLILKLEMHMKEGMKKMIEVQKLSFAKPPAGMLDVPASCRE
jgi:hypothetical protein